MYTTHTVQFQVNQSQSHVGISILARCSQWLRVLDFFQNKNIGISQNAGFRGFSYGFVVVQVVFTFFDRTTSLGFGWI